MRCPRCRVCVSDLAHASCTRLRADSIRCPARPDANRFPLWRSRKVRLHHSRGSYDQLACNTLGDSGRYARMAHCVAKAIQRDSTGCLVGFYYGAPHGIRSDSPATHALRARVPSLEPRALPGRNHPSREQSNQVHDWQATCVSE